MSRTTTTFPNSSLNDAGTARTRADRPDPAPRSRFRPDVTEADRRHPPIASEFRGSRTFDLDLAPQPAGTGDEAVWHERELDLDPLSRTLIMLPPRPRSHFGSRRQTPAVIRPGDCHELETPGFDEMLSLAPTVNIEAPRGRNELGNFFGDIEAAPAPARSWGGWFLGLFVSAWSLWRRESEISRSIAALSLMDDRSLRDIGIEHRLQIPAIVRHGRKDA